jgi:hypothetical protein
VLQSSSTWKAPYHLLTLSISIICFACIVVHLHGLARA